MISSPVHLPTGDTVYVSKSLEHGFADQELMDLFMETEKLCSLLSANPRPGAKGVNPGPEAEDKDPDRQAGEKQRGIFSSSHFGRTLRTVATPIGKLTMFPQFKC